MKFSKKILYYVLIFNIGFCYSQQKLILVQYQSQKGSLSNTETLISNGKKAIYVTDSLFSENTGNVIEEDEYTNSFTISSKSIKLDRITYYLNQDSNLLYYINSTQDVKTSVKDSLPDFNWNIENSVNKNISGFACTKATTNFRGSKITAWFTKEIPIPFGPWKFKDLPGLILEVYDTNEPSKYYWAATSIKYPYEKKVNFEMPNKNKILSFKEDVEKRESKLREMMSQGNARLPKGVTATKSTLSRIGIEKIYEWEEKL